MSDFVKERMINMLEKLKEVKARWENELSTIYGGELEVDYLDGNYFACVFHNESKGEYDAWMHSMSPTKGAFSKVWKCNQPTRCIETKTANQAKCSNRNKFQMQEQIRPQKN